MNNQNKPANKSKAKSSTKLFFSGVVILTVANLLIKAIGLLFKIPMNSVVGDEGMGYYTSAYTIYTFFYMISTAGLPVAVSIMISESRTKGELRQIKRIFKTTVILFVVIGLVGMAIMIAGAKGFSALMKSDPTYLSIIAIAPALFFICVSSVLRGYFQGFQQMMPTAMSELIEAICKLAIGIIMAMYAIEKGYSINVVAAYAIIGITIGTALSMLFLFISKIFFNESKYTAEFIETNGISEKTEPVGRILGKLIAIALPITISASVMSLTNMIDMALVQRLLQAIGKTQEEATTIYGNYTTLAVPMFNLPPILIYPISCAIVPLLSVARSQGDEKRSRTIMESSLRVSVLIGVPCACGMSVLSKQILSLFFRKQDSIEMAYPLLRILALATLFLCILSVTNAILQACHKQWLPMVSMFAGAVVKLITNFILIRYIGMMSTPISTFLCYLTAVVLNFVFVTKYTKIVPNVLKVFVRPFLCGILCAAAALGADVVLVRFVPDKLATLAAILVAAFVYLILIFITRAVTSEDILLLPKGDKLCGIMKKLKLLKE